MCVTCLFVCLSLKVHNFPGCIYLFFFNSDVNSVALAEEIVHG